MGSLVGLHPNDLCSPSLSVFSVPLLPFPRPSLSLSFFCQFLKTPLLHTQTKRSMLCIKAINSTCRYTTITQMGAEYCVSVMLRRGEMQSNRDVQNKTGEGWREAGGGRDGGSRQGGKRNVTSHIWLFTSHLADTSKISGGKITALILLDKGLCVWVHLLFQQCTFHIQAL